MGQKRSGRAGPRAVAAGAAATLAGLALAAGGCGGDGGGGAATNRIASVPTTTTPAGKAPQPKAQHPKSSGSSKSGSSSGAKSSPESALARLAPSKRVALVEKSARIVMAVMGVKNATFAASQGGRSLNVTLSRSDACVLEASDVGKAELRIRLAVPYVRTVTLGVAGGGALADYVRSNCARPKLPAGRGPVVLTAQGSGISTTRAFTVHSRRWSIEYANRGRFFQVLPMRGGVPTPGSFAVQSPGSGKRVVVGSGHYTLRVGSLGAWTVRVRDGA